MSGVPYEISDAFPEIKSNMLRQGHPRFYELLDEIAELHDKKNHDYAQDGDPLSNLRRSENFGIPGWKGILIRLSDKWSRLEELSKKEARVKEESIKDTLLDNAIYSLLAVVLLEEDEKKHLTKPRK